MVAMNKYTIGYAKSLVVATPQAQLADPHRPKVVRGLSGNQIALMERESANLEREFRLAEDAYGINHLDLVVAKGYLGKLLNNDRVVNFLTHYHKEILTELQKIAEIDAAAA
jgi:hypothetical protein